MIFFDVLVLLDNLNFMVGNLLGVFVGGCYGVVYVFV